MGDIAFLLTIFFILCSNFTTESKVKYTSPRAPDVETVKESKLSVAMDFEGKIFLNGKPVASAKELGSILQSKVSGRGDAAARSVMFKCDLGVKRVDFEPVLEAIVTAGGVIVAVGEKKSDK
jgi:biopolymer transport protein ExbD